MCLMVQPYKDSSWGFEKRAVIFKTTSTNAFQHDCALPLPSAAKPVARIPNRNISQLYSSVCCDGFAQISFTEIKEVQRKMTLL